jgi:hypothetical protein
MSQYLLSVYQPDSEPPPPQVLGPIMAKLGEWNASLRAAGEWVFTAGLHSPSTATVVRVADGEDILTDGPFAEGKEHVGGFTVIAVADLDAALDRASQVARITGLPIEVRPMHDSAGQGDAPLAPAAGGG